jgi:hypothetical protein
MSTLKEKARGDVGSLTSEESSQKESPQEENSPEKNSGAEKKESLANVHQETGLLESLAGAKAEGEEKKVEELQRLLARMRDRLGEGGLFLPREVVAPEDHSEEEIASALSAQLGRTEPIDPPGLPKEEKGAGQVNTYRLRGRPEDWEAAKCEEMSGMRYALGPAIEHLTGTGLRACRIEVFEPKATGLHDPDVAEEKGVPFPQGKEEWTTASEVGLGGWQLTKIYERLKAFMADTGRLMYYTEPKGADGTYTVSAMDWQLGVALAKGDVGQMHYISTTLSGVGTFGYGEDHEPDYEEEVFYKALAPEEISPVEELIGHGLYAKTENGEETLIVDGGSIKVPAPQQESAEKALESQFRLITHYEDLAGVSSQGESSREESSQEESSQEALRHVFEEAGVAKGTTYPIRRRRLWAAVEGFYAECEELQEQGETEVLDARLQRYLGAALLIERLLLRTERTGNSAILLAREDQLKIPTSRDEGTGLFVGTYLRGTAERSAMERPQEKGSCEGSEEKIRVTPPTGSGPVPDQDRLETWMPGPHTGEFQWASHEKVRRAHGLSPNRTGELPVYEGTAHAFTGESPGRVASGSMGPAQFRISGNWQPFQCLKPGGIRRLFDHEEKCLEEIASKMKMPQGIAELTSEEVARKRKNITEGRREEGRGEGDDETVRQGQDLLSSALLSGLISAKTDDYAAGLAGEEAALGESRVQTVGPVKSRIGRVVASRIDNFVLRGCGTESYGYIHHACENSMELLRRRWSIFEKATCDPSSIAVPKRITSMMNADDDGDLISGLSAIVAGPGGGSPRQQLRKITMLWRYPCVDEPIFMASPPSVETPFDPRTEEEARRFGRIIEVFQPVVRSGEPDLHSDQVTIATPISSWRLSDQGAKESVQKQKISEEITPESAFRFIKRGKSINATGRLTRRLERFFDLAWMAERESRKQGKGVSPCNYSQALPRYLRRARVVSVACEEQITAFQSETGGADPKEPSMALNGGGSADPFGHVDDDHIRDEILPLRHHGLFGRIETCTSRVAGREETSIEELMTAGPDGRRRIDRELSGQSGAGGQSRRAMMLRAHFRPDRAMGKVLGAMKDIGSDPGHIRSQLGKETSGADPDQVALADQAIALWREAWSLASGRASSRLSAAQSEAELEAAKRGLKRERTAQSRALRGLMRWVGHQIDRPSLRKAIAEDLKKPGGDSQTGQESSDYQPSPAAGIALAEGRIGEVMPLAGATYKPAPRDSTVSVVFAKGTDLAGPESIFGLQRMEPQEGTAAFTEPDTEAETGLHEGVFETGGPKGNRVKLFADEAVPEALQGPICLVPLSKRRAALVKRRY